MSSRDDDDIIEFDFFDEPPTVEKQQPQRVRMPRRPRREGGGPPIRPPQGFTPLLRLIGLIAFAILIVVLLVFWVQSCQGASKRSKYRNYVEDVGTIAKSSAAVGRELADALTTQGVTTKQLQNTLTGLAQREQQDVARAQELDPPGPLRQEHTAAVEALQFRLSGLQGLAASLRTTASTKADAALAQTLAAQSQRFAASDVVWDDLFKDPTIAELQNEDISGVEVPDSNFLADPELATPQAWTEGILPRLRGATTGGTRGGGPHGSALEYVKAMPEGKQLSTSTDNIIVATTDLKFAVGVKDSGNSQEVGIEVTLTIQKTGQPIVRTQKIRVIDPGQVKVVTFADLGDLPFGRKTTLKVDIAPVEGEARTENNSASYPVIFSLTP